MTRLTLGSLFSGSGCFELAGYLHGVEPVWASEVSPFPIRVTTKRFPHMKHYGNIYKMNGANIEPVDIICGGSSCQNLSIAGNGKGLDGAESVVFFEMIRIIKEMREKTNGQYPKYAIWENVANAIHSRGGSDFQRVLEEFCGIVAPTTIPRPKKWSNSGCIMGNGYSVGWRVMDTQYWGLPQHRERVFIVVNLSGGGFAGLPFEREGSIWNTEEMPTTREQDDTCVSAGTGRSNSVREVERICMRLQAFGKYTESEIASTLKSRDYKDATDLIIEWMPDYTPIAVYDARGNGDGRIANTLTGDHNNRITDYSAAPVPSPPAPRQFLIRRLTPLECCRLQGLPDAWCDDLGVENPTEEELAFWEGVFNEWSAINKKKRKTRNQIIKWLANPRSDAAEYQLYGNGISLPVAYRVIHGVVRALREEN